MQNLNSLILAIESSCDDTACAVLRNDVALSNVSAGQEVHSRHGGVIPELASRDHEKNIIPVVEAALKKAGVTLAELNAIAVTTGPGLMGSLLVGLSFAKSLALALNIPLIEVNHMQAHILAHFIKQPGSSPSTQQGPTFPFLCLTVSGGHTQLIKVTDHLSFELIGETIDDAVGEAFDKAAKIMGLPYPGGPVIDKLAETGDRNKFKFAFTKVSGYNYSFSGIKTSFLYFIQNNVKEDKNFIGENMNDICASYQHHLIAVLLKNVRLALKETGIKQLAIAGGVAANSELRWQVKDLEEDLEIKTFIPKLEYCTDNAAMIGIVGYYKYLKKEFSQLGVVPNVRMKV